LDQKCERKKIIIEKIITEKIIIIIPMKLYFESFESSCELKEDLERRANLLTE